MSAKIYTKTGDEGKTGVIGNTRIWKNDPRIIANGSLDELNSLLGVLVSSGDLNTAEIPEILEIQKDLMNISAYLAGLESKKSFDISERVSHLETWMDNLSKDLTPLKNFIIPGGTETASWTHFVRTVCRRAERDMVALYQTMPFDKSALSYVNRLSDLLFTLSRSLNHRAGREDILWK